MDYTYHQMYLKENKNEENGSGGSKNPYKVFLNEVLIIYLRELAIYIIKLKKLGITNEKIKEGILEAISIGILNVECDEEYFLNIIKKLYDGMSQAKELYIDVCKRNNIKFNLIKSNLKNPSKLSFSDLIRIGQKNFNLKYTKLNLDQMSLIELFLNVIKSVCVHLIELKMLDFDDEKAYEALLLLFSWKNDYMPLLPHKLPKTIKNLVNIDNNLLKKLHDIKREKYGEIESAEISLTIKSNKAILVSGSNLRELELLLEATKDKNIDVYTHGHMISAHLYQKFKTYPHLIGHFGGELSNYMVDFTNFPGTILLTRNSFLNVEKLFTCRIYTTDIIASKGIGIIKNHNYEHLIESALHAEGFIETTYKQPIKFELSEKEIIEKITEVAQKIESGEIKHFFVIGISNNTKVQEEYFKKFLNLLGNDSFVMSFSYSNGNGNVLNVQDGYEFALLYKALDILTRNISIEQLNPVILFTRCEIHLFSNILYMKTLGINKIYFTDCSSSIINPALTSFVRKTFDIKEYTTPEQDLKEMLSVNSE